MPLPFLEVAHLPSSTSFYSAITQPLGLRYVTVDTTKAGGEDAEQKQQQRLPTGPSITYGVSQRPVFQVRQHTDRPLKLSHVVLTAPSAQAVRDFHAFALRANPPPKSGPVPSRVQGLPLLAPTADPPAQPGNKDETPTRTRVSDLDGNIMEVVYVPPSNYPAGHPGSTVRRTQSTKEEVSRIMNWNYDVATAGPAPSAVGAPARSSAGRHYAPSRHPGDLAPPEPPYVLRRSVTTSIMEPMYPAGSPRESPKAATGMSTGMVGLLGAAVGAAAGAAVTYSMLTRDRSQAPAQEFEAPMFQRRSTFPEPFPDTNRSRYVELERTVEKIHYPDQYPLLEDGPGSAPAYVARYSQAGTRAPDEMTAVEDSRTRISSRYHVGAPPHAASVRNPTEVSARGAPLLLTETEHRSYAGSRHSGEADHRSYAPSKYGGDADHRTYAPSRHSGGEGDHRSYAPSRYGGDGDHRSYAGSRHPAAAPPAMSVARGSTYNGDRAETYVSTRSHRTGASTLKPMPATAETQVSMGMHEASSYPPPPGMSSGRSMAGTRVTAATMRDPMASAPRTFSRVGSTMTARQVPLPASTVGSHMSARHVPLPQSVNGWEGEDDIDSIAPSDSISCVGSSTRKSRAYH